MGLPGRRAWSGPERGPPRPPSLWEGVGVLGRFCHYRNNPKGLRHRLYPHGLRLTKNQFGSIGLALKFCLEGGPPLSSPGTNICGLSVLHIMLDFGQPGGSRSTFHATEERQINAA